MKYLSENQIRNNDFLKLCTYRTKSGAFGIGFIDEKSKTIYRQCGNVFEPVFGATLISWRIGKFLKKTGNTLNSLGTAGFNVGKGNYRKRKKWDF